MLIVDMQSVGENIKYYGGYTEYQYDCPPSGIPIQPLVDNYNENVYGNILNITTYNSAILKYNGAAYICIIFQQSVSHVMGYYNNSPWTFFAAQTQYNNIYAPGTWLTTNLNGVTVLYCANFATADSVNDSELPVFTDPQEYMDYITTLYTPPVQTYTSNGGGATHIAKVTGQLSSLSNNLSDILIVSGGGGGGMLIGNTAYPGADAGGIAGNGTNSADQTSGYAFGQGEDG